MVLSFILRDYLYLLFLNYLVVVLVVVPPNETHDYFLVAYHSLILHFRLHFLLFLDYHHLLFFLDEDGQV